MSDLVEWLDPPEENPNDGWHGNLHIHAPPISGRMKQAPTLEHWPDWEGKVFTDCCACNMDPKDTLSSGAFQDYYGWNFKHVCAPGKGCDANPRRKFGAQLRYETHWGW